MIEEIEKYFDSKLPSTYKRFLSSHDGKSITDVRLYSVDEIIERNECYETKTYAPGYINIGDDGGGMAFIIRLNEHDPKVYTVGHGSMSPEYKEIVCSSFSEWQKTGFSAE